MPEIISDAVRKLADSLAGRFGNPATAEDNRDYWEGNARELIGLVRPLLRIAFLTELIDQRKGTKSHSNEGYKSNHTINSYLLETLAHYSAPEASEGGQ